MTWNEARNDKLPLWRLPTREEMGYIRYWYRADKLSFLQISLASPTGSLWTSTQHPNDSDMIITLVSSAMRAGLMHRTDKLRAAYVRNYP